jgi:hypothetical protein
MIWRWNTAYLTSAGIEALCGLLGIEVLREVLI